MKKEKQKEKVVDDEMRKGKSEANTEKKKDSTPNEGKEVPYPLVPSRKDKERHLAIFLDIFKKLEITLLFGEALQQIPLYAKFLKDMLIKKNQYIHSDRIVVEGNCKVHEDVANGHRIRRSEISTMTIYVDTESKTVLKKKKLRIVINY